MCFLKIVELHLLVKVWPTVFYVLLKIFIQEITFEGLERHLWFLSSDYVSS